LGTSLRIHYGTDHFIFNQEGYASIEILERRYDDLIFIQIKFRFKKLIKINHNRLKNIRDHLVD